jgi:undecaprenyl-diphosphatase
MKRVRDKPQKQVPAHRQGLRVPCRLANQPLIGIGMVLIGAVFFGVLAHHLKTQGPLLQWDQPLANELYERAIHGPQALVTLMIVAFYLGKEVVIALVFILGFYFLYNRFWRELTMLVIGFSGAAPIWFALIAIFQRPRPSFEAPVWKVLNTHGFPSGHTITAVVSYFFLAYLFAANVKSLFWKWVIVISAILMVLLIGYSRLYLGDHYLTDVVAGYAVGLIWAGLAYTTLELIFCKR